jgi:hypothetical protein
LVEKSEIFENLLLQNHWANETKFCANRPFEVLWSSSKILSVYRVDYPRWPQRLIMQLLVYQHYLKFHISDLTNTHVVAILDVGQGHRTP